MADKLVGMNKGRHDASVCLIERRRGRFKTEIFLKERFTRVKRDGGVVLTDLLDRIQGRLGNSKVLVAENSYGHRPCVSEAAIDRKAPYYEALKGRGHSLFCSKLNPGLKFLSHHYCHALAAAAVSPFNRALILVFDGAGNYHSELGRRNPELKHAINPLGRRNRYDFESLSVYSQEGAGLTCLHKEWQGFRKWKARGAGFKVQLSEGLGMFYETSALYVFNSVRQAGKIMGLAAFGTPRPVTDRIGFFKALDWGKAFRGRTKAEWQACPGFQLYADIAASTQVHFEESLLSIVSDLKKKYPAYSNLILTGGCALNCVANTKVVEAGFFRKVYVPPFPSDEGISLGAAHYLRLKGFYSGRRKWRGVSWARQIANFGPGESVPRDAVVQKAFKGYPMRKLPRAPATAAALLSRGLVLGWFQGRSESGPRALGYRSLLASPLAGEIKDRLNRRIKKREDFRPYGCSVLWECSHKFFSVKPGFDSPFMSFAPLVLPLWRRKLKGITHADGTSRIQTVRRSQNPIFYSLLKSFERRTGIGVLLNTSLNGMGEPIVETVQDLRWFFDRVPVDALIVGDWLVGRPGMPLPD